MRRAITENEECLIGEFCKEMKGKIEENEREYKTKISKQESIENWTEGALERIKSVVDKYSSFHNNPNRS